MRGTHVRSMEEELEYTIRKRRYLEKRRLMRKRRLIVFSIITASLCVVCFFVGVLVGRSFVAEGKQIANPSEKIESEPTINLDRWNLILVNQEHAIKEDFTVKLVETEQHFQIDERVKEPLEQMLNDMRAEGLHPYLCSAYRSFEKQEELFQKKVSTLEKQGYSLEEAKEEASRWVAVPGTSEHQLGLAVDLVSEDNQKLDESQEQTKEQQWLIENSYKYGFILRYPKEKSHITKIGYEPWHYRYVGIDVAIQIMKEGICLEEYITKSYDSSRKIYSYLEIHNRFGLLLAV